MVLQPRYLRKHEIAAKKKAEYLQKSRAKKSYHLDKANCLCFRYIFRPNEPRYGRLQELIHFFASKHNDLYFQRRMWFKYKIYSAKLKIHSNPNNDTIHCCILLQFFEDSLIYKDLYTIAGPNRKFTYPNQLKFIQRAFREIADLLGHPRINVGDNAIDTYYAFIHDKEYKLDIKTYPEMLQLFRTRDLKYTIGVDLLGLRSFAQELAEDKLFLYAVRTFNKK